MYFIYLFIYLFICLFIYLFALQTICGHVLERLVYKKCRIDIIPTSFLLGFCLKNLHLSDIQLAHLGVSLTTIFEPILSAYLYNLNNKFALFYYVGAYV